MLGCSIFLVYYIFILISNGEPSVDYFEEDSTEFLTDIRIERSHGTSRSKRSMVSNINRLWPGAIIPFKIEEEALVDKEILRKGMRRWEERTCIRFVPWNSKTVKTLPHDDRINFFKEGRCRSVVGRYSIKQFINACNTLFGVIHELGHSIGVYHEHNRPDRDEHITMLWQNVPQEEASRYQKMMTATINVEYDLGSVMHYGKYGPLGSKFVTVDPLKQYDVGPSSDITFYDAKSVNTAYNCSAKCSRKLKCINGGYQGHKCKCICPEKYMGKYCHKRNTTVEDKCRFALTDDIGSISSPNFPLHYDNKVYCMWYIKVKPDYKIVLNFTSFNVEPAPECKADSVLIRKDDLYNGGESFCGFDLPPVIVTSSNKAWVRMYTDMSTTETGFHLNYYSIPKHEETDNANCWRRSCYKFFDEEVSMFEAQRICHRVGGALPVISSATENELLRRKVTQMLPGKYLYWIALNDINTEGRYVWGSTTQEQSFYHNFVTSPPSQIFRNIIDCVVSDVYGGWKERYCSWNASVVCEIWKSKTSKASFNKWSEWSDCPVSCGGAVQDRVRVCNFPGECTGVARERRVCNTYSCPGSVARGKPTYASSVWKWDPASVVDGYFWPKIIDSHASSLVTQFQYKPWWKVDLEDIFVVKHLRITKCLGYDFKTPWADATVGFNSELTLNPVCSHITLRHDRIQTPVQCTRPLLGKVVGIQANSWNTLCVTEVEVFTTGSALSCPRDIQLVLPHKKSGSKVFWPVDGSRGIGVLECSHTPGSVFKEGVTHVQCDVRDTVYREFVRRCSFRIEIIVCDVIRDGRCTRFIHKKQTRAQAQDACIRNGGELLTIRSEFQNKRIQSTIAYNGKALRTPWLGYNDMDNDGVWTWTSGLESPISKLINPKSGKYKYGLQCATFKPNGYWRMTSCTDKASTICETDIKFPKMVCPTKVSMSIQTGSRNLYVYWSDDPIVVDPLERKFTTFCSPKSGFNVRPGTLKKVTCIGYANVDGAVVQPCTFHIRACSRTTASHCYFMSDELLQWKDAKKRCQSLGGAIATADSSNENEVLQNVLLRTYKYVEDVWIGYTFKTASQSKYSNMEKTLSIKESKLCISIKRNGKWTVVGCSQLRRSICAIPIGPETMTAIDNR
ncbi:uncharacterized protein [Antedon mediterranea]|uniref:uncharacterized protein n=1 Tax=Antedon mediterranea TaxID=105859 RepID=UPI003AF682EA